MKIELSVPDYISERGLQIEWEPSFVIETRIIDGPIHIKANRAGLISLARHMLTLAQSEVPLGWHIHYDDGNSLEEGSQEMIIEKI